MSKTSYAKGQTEKNIFFWILFFSFSFLEPNSQNFCPVWKFVWFLRRTSFSAKKRIVTPDWQPFDHFGQKSGTVLNANQGVHTCVSVMHFPFSKQILQPRPGTCSRTPKRFSRSSMPYGWSQAKVTVIGVQSLWNSLDLRDGLMETTVDVGDDCFRFIGACFKAMHLFGGAKKDVCRVVVLWYHRPWVSW